jgi:Protein of unknown function (DUF2806)
MPRIKLGLIALMLSFVPAYSSNEQDRNEDQSMSLIDLGALTKPATVLIEKISDAVGGIAKPWQIRRVARAEATAEIIRSEARLQISELEERALLRMIREEGNKQENIENITAKAIPHVLPDAEPEKIENDWLSHFFDRCRLISDDEMQTMWAAMLAGEANRPGSFSKRTIDLVATLDKTDAELFTKFCTFVWVVRQPCPFIDIDNEIYKTLGLIFDTLTHLDTIGLIIFDNVIHLSLEKLEKRILIKYYDVPIVIEFPLENDENTMAVGRCLLTQAGKELAPICGSVKSEDYLTHILKVWMDAGYVLTSPVG